MTDPALLRDGLSALGTLAGALLVFFGFFVVCILVNERQEKRRARRCL